MEWYYAESGNQIGPIDEKEFQDLVEKGKITSNTLVWNPSMKDWQEYGKGSNGERNTFPDAGKPAQEGYCVECGKAFNQSEMIQYQNSWICAACKPVFFQKLKEGITTPGAMEYGGFWIRFGAKIIDGIVLWVINSIVSIPLNLMMFRSITMSAESTPRDVSGLMGYMAVSYIVSFSIMFGYSMFFLGKYGATPGKMACKLKVVTSDGGKISYLRALARPAAEFLSSIILCVGYIMAAFDSEKRALHDRICDTRVIRS